MSRLIAKLAGKSNISVMADCDFTIRDQLKAVGADVNIPPFMEGRALLPSAEVLQGRKIASVSIQAISWSIAFPFFLLKRSLPIALSRIANQIVCVCCWLVNFNPPPVVEEGDVSKYFQTYYSSNSDSDAVSELSDEDM